MAASLVLVGRGARNEDQPTALRATPNPLSLPKRGLRPFLDNPDNLTRMYTLCRDSCVWYDARVAVSKVWLIERASTVRNAFHFASSIRCFFLFFFFSNWNYFIYIKIYRAIKQHRWVYTKYWWYIVFAIWNCYDLRMIRFYKERNGEEKKWDKWIGRWAYENKKSGNCKL